MDETLETTEEPNERELDREPQPDAGESFRHFQRRRVKAVEEALFRAGERCLCTGMVVTCGVSDRCTRCGKITRVTWRTPWPK